jgi:hypothetical protein
MSEPKPRAVRAQDARRGFGEFDRRRRGEGERANRMSDDLKRIDALEAENAELRRQCEHYASRLAAHGLLAPAFDAPNPAQTTALLRLVETRYPRLAPSVQEPQHREHFLRALRFLSTVFRTEIFSQYAIAAHCEAAAQWARRFGLPELISRRAFVSACCAAHVKTSDLAGYPNSAEIAIALEGNTREPRADWRQTLAEGLRPPAVVPNRIQRPEPSPVQITSASPLARPWWLS